MNCPKSMQEECGSVKFSQVNLISYNRCGDIFSAPMEKEAELAP